MQTCVCILQHPTIFLPYLDNVVNFCGYGFIEAMMEPHAREAAGLTPAETSSVFIIIGAVYFFSMLEAGWVSDHVRSAAAVSVVGNVVMAVAMILVGPAPFLPLAPTKTIMYVGAALIGFGYAQTMVSTFSRANDASQRLGFSTDIKTYIVVAGEGLRHRLDPVQQCFSTSVNQGSGRRRSTLATSWAPRRAGSSWRRSAFLGRRCGMQIFDD